MKYKNLVFTHKDLLAGVFEELAEKRLPGKISIIQFTSHFRHRQKYSDTKTSVRSLFTRSVRYMTIHVDRFTFRLQAAGIAVMAVGIFARVSASNYSALMDEGGFKTAANILIAAGALVMIIGAIGCGGVVKEKKWLLLLVSCDIVKLGLIQR